jgi:creatinine amidohydrolase
MPKRISAAMKETDERVVLWRELGAPAIHGKARRGAVALWPIGSTEQHGAHLATGFDLASATAVCELAAEIANAEIVMLPGLALGSSDHWLPLGATLSLRAETLELVVRDVVRSCANAGFERLVIVNGHAGNITPALTAVARETGSARVEFISYWTLVDEAALIAACRTDDGGIGHAGEIETSIGLFLGEPWLVSPELPAEPGAILAAGMPGSRLGAPARPPNPLSEAPNGVYGDPREARRELGALVIEQAATALARLLKDGVS